MNFTEFVCGVLLGPKFLKRRAKAVVRRILPAEIRRSGVTIVLNPKDTVVGGLLLCGMYERAETKLFCRACKPGMTILDIGAHVGYYTALALRCTAGQGAIVAVEPDQENFGYLRRTVAANGGGSVTCVPKALGAERGIMRLYVCSDNRGDNRLCPHEAADQSYDVEVVTADELLGSVGIERVDLVKMDVQGFEGHVLRGMRETLERSRDVVMLLEYWPQGLRDAGTDPKQMLLDLKYAGFRLFEVGTRGRLVRIEDPSCLIKGHRGEQYATVVAARGGGLSSIGEAAV